MADETTKTIIHRRAVGFSTVYASGIVSSLVPNSGLFNLTFYEDVVGVRQETLASSSETTAISTIEESGLEPHREDKVRVSMRPETVVALVNLLQEQLKTIQAAGNGGA
jgi:hypothetical protein